MGKVVPFLLLLAIAGCAFPNTRWEKKGADEKVASDDLLTCRHAAQQEAYYATPFTGPTRLYGYVEANRFENESRLTSFCMRNKGYELVTVGR